MVLRWVQGQCKLRSLPGKAVVNLSNYFRVTERETFHLVEEIKTEKRQMYSDKNFSKIKNNLHFFFFKHFSKHLNA